MKYTVYVKKEIKSEADLPKEDKWYIGFSGVINDFIHFNPKTSICKDIDWYLQPIELDMPDDEEITTEFTKEHYTYDIGRHLRVNKDRIFGAKTIRDKIKNQLK